MKNAMQWLALASFAGAMTCAAEASAGNAVLYFHGRSMGGWPDSGRVITPAGWVHVDSNYDGNARINDSSTRTSVKNMLKTYCHGSGNSCVVLCFSVGCVRMLKGIDELGGTSTPADKITWIEGSASAAGGTEVANATSKWWAKLLAKVFGQYASVDADLTTSSMRNGFSYIQNDAPATMYQEAGKKDMCVKFLWGLIRLCGNDHFPGDYGDGAVPAHSACGFNTVSTRADCNGSNSYKYTNRRVSGDGELVNVDHVGMIAKGVVATTVRLGKTQTLNPVQRPTVSTSNAKCVDTRDDCDAWLDTSTSKTPGELYGVGSGVGPVSEKDACLDVDANGCSYCSEFTIASMAYGTSCNGYKGVETFANSTTRAFMSEAVTRPDNQTLDFGNATMELTNGVTVSLSKTGIAMALNPSFSTPNHHISCGTDVQGNWYIRNSTLTNDHAIRIDYTTLATEIACVVCPDNGPCDGDDHFYTNATYSYSSTLTFSGAKVMKSKVLPSDKDGDAKWGGNQLWLKGFTSGLKKYLVVHSADMDNTWVGDPNCADGIASGTACCWSGCGTCGGSDCSTKPGGAAACCTGTINTNSASCDIRSAPCKL